jgi:hypothetical protein
LVFGHLNLFRISSFALRILVAAKDRAVLPVFPITKYNPALMPNNNIVEKVIIGKFVFSGGYFAE